jgi:hypothetical protein
MKPTFNVSHPVILYTLSSVEVMGTKCKPRGFRQTYPIRSPTIIFVDFASHLYLDMITGNMELVSLWKSD